MILKKKSIGVGWIVQGPTCIDRPNDISFLLAVRVVANAGMGCSDVTIHSPMEDITASPGRCGRRG